MKVFNTFLIQLLSFTNWKVGRAATKPLIQCIFTRNNNNNFPVENI